MQANIAGYSSKLAKDAIPTSQFSHSAELQKIPSHRYCSQQTNSVPRAQLSLSLARDMLDCVRYYYSSHKIPRALSLSRFSILSTVHKNAFHWALRISWWRQNSSGSLEILDRAPPRFSTVFVNNIRRALTVLTPESFLFSFFCVFFRCVCYLFCSLWCFFWCLKTFFMWSTTAYIVPKGAKKTANCSWDL